MLGSGLLEQVGGGKPSTEVPREKISQGIHSGGWGLGRTYTSQLGAEKRENVFPSASVKNVFAMEIPFNK